MPLSQLTPLRMSAACVYTWIGVAAGALSNAGHCALARALKQADHRRTVAEFNHHAAGEAYVRTVRKRRRGCGHRGCYDHRLDTT